MTVETILLAFEAQGSSFSDAIKKLKSSVEVILD